MSKKLSTAVYSVALSVTECDITCKKPTSCSSMCSVVTNELKAIHDGISLSSQEVFKSLSSSGSLLPMCRQCLFVLINHVLPFP